MSLLGLLLFLAAVIACYAAAPPCFFALGW